MVRYAGEQIFEQANTNVNKSVFGSIIYNVKAYNAAGDGESDDTANLQSTLTVAKTAGSGIVWVPDGTYIITNYLKIPSNVTLFLSPGAVIKRGSNVNLMFTNDADGVTGGYLANENISIVGGTIDGNRNVFTAACTAVGFGHCTNILIENVTFVDVPIWHMIELNSTNHGIVRGCTFDNNGGSGTTESVQIDGAFGSAQFPWFGPYDSTPCYDITIEDCWFKNGVDGIGSHFSTSTVFHEFIRIIKNRFNNMSGIGIKPLNYKELHMEGNMFDTLLHGISVTKDAGTAVADAKGYKVIGNTFKNIAITGQTGSRAVYFNTVSDIIVTGNIVDTSERYGITFDFCQNVSLSNNNVQNCGQAGMWGFGSQTVQFENNIVVNNNTSAAASRYDIMCGFVSGTISVNCKIIGNHCGTMAIQYADQISLSKNTILTSLSNTLSTNVLLSDNFIAGVLNRPTVTLGSGTNRVQQEGFTSVNLVSTGQASVVITFPVAFSGIPDTFVSLGGTGRTFATASGTTTTQVTIYVNNLDATTTSTTVRWFAIGAM